jgi:hypothetical protein
MDADIKPTGMNQAQEVDLLYQIVASLAGICAKLDADGGVPMTDYVANCITAIFDIDLYDSKGNSSLHGGRFSIMPAGLTPQARQELLYEIFNSFETLTEQLDSDVITGSDYESLCYTAKFLGIVENQAGSQLGNGTTYYFRNGAAGQKELVDLYYNIVDAIETLTEKLDLDGTVTDTNYEALWFTAVVLTTVGNSAGNVVGN